QPRSACGSEGLGGSQRAAMWILPAGADHAGSVAAFLNAQAFRRRHRLGDGRQYLPLRDLPADPRRHQGSGEGASMITIENVSRRGFLQGMLSASAFVLFVRQAPLLAR